MWLTTPIDNIALAREILAKDRMSALLAHVDILIAKALQQKNRATFSMTDRLATKLDDCPYYVRKLPSRGKFPRRSPPKEPTPRRQRRDDEFVSAEWWSRNASQQLPPMPSYHNSKTGTYRLLASCAVLTRMKIPHGTGIYLQLGHAAS
jgi:hypothetical protein